MKVWHLPRGTIQQFADAMASEPAALPVDVIHFQLRRAVWLGEFDDRMYLSNGFAAPDDDESWTMPWTRKLLGEALMGCIRGNQANWVLSDPREWRMPSFEAIAAYNLNDYDRHFLAAYLHELHIETAAVKEWRELNPGQYEVVKSVLGHSSTKTCNRRRQNPSLKRPDCPVAPEQKSGSR